MDEETTGLSESQRTAIHEWIEDIDLPAIRLWAGVIDQLRHTSEDMWRSTRFFFALIGVLLSATALVIVQAKLSTNGPPATSQWAGGVLLGLAFFGTAITFLGAWTLRRQRRYYTGVMLRKTIIEDALGFCDPGPASINLSIPWTISGLPEDKLGKKMKKTAFGPGLETPSAFEISFLYEGRVTNSNFIAYGVAASLFLVVAFVGSWWIGAWYSGLVPFIFPAWFLCLYIEDRKNRKKVERTMDKEE